MIGRLTSPWYELAVPAGSGGKDRLPMRDGWRRDVPPAGPQQGTGRRSATAARSAAATDSDQLLRAWNVAHTGSNVKPVSWPVAHTV